MLRRLGCLLLSLSLILTFCSCFKAKSSEKPVTTGFECDVDMQYGEMNVKGHLTRSTAGTLLMDVKEPSSLKGLSMEWNGETVSLKLHGLSFGVNPDAVPQSALGLGIINALDAALGIHEDGNITSEGVSTKGSSLGGEFEIVSDPTTGSLLSLKIPSLDLTAHFSNFSITNGTTKST